MCVCVCASHCVFFVVSKWLLEFAYNCMCKYLYVKCNCVYAQLVFVSVSICECTKPLCFSARARVHYFFVSASHVVP